MIRDLEAAHCVETDEAGNCYATTMGRIASYYYLSYKTADMFYTRMTDGATVKDLLQVLCDAAEFDDLPVRHNEDNLNEELARQVRGCLS